MSELASFVREGEAGIITINNPPVNALSPGVPEAIYLALQRAVADEAVRSIVLIGGGRTFIAGADIREFEKIVCGARDKDLGLHPMLRALEECPKPIVCAIHGTAFGGGLEVDRKSVV
jgi:3-hydroxyacyl-CoA dehydrogenase